MAKTATLHRAARLPAGVAIAPCFFQIPDADADAGNLYQVQALPVGPFVPRDGREMSVDAWRIDAASAQALIDAFRATRTPLVIDYEHQTLLAEDNGQPAPAAGWVRDMEWRDGSGLWLTVELTERARQYVAAGEYRYFSPVFSYDLRTGAVQRLLMGALTNNPAIDGMAQIAPRAAARFHLDGAPAMNEHLLALAVRLGLDASAYTDEAALTAAINGRIDAAASRVSALCQQLELQADADDAAIGSAITALRNRTAAPDPARYVEIGVVESLRNDIAALTAQANTRAVDDLVAPALADGRLLPALEAWARDLGGKDIAALRAYLDKAQPLAALTGTQTGGRRPTATASADGLTEDELAVCAATGIAPKDFAVQKAA
ncbi:phage protease [Thermomonas sp.]|uniref:phage protease n=1 Tax=Thermomonas sp. TaxID=1971895 RepID=UPI002635BCF3|nr:phage protease [Thermomonas sp.]